MNEIVLNVESDYETTLQRDSYEGFKITTDQQEIFVLISTARSCCEEFDIMMYPRNFKLEGHIITNIRYGEKSLDDDDRILDGHQYVCVHITIATQEDPIQIVAYNIHDGYYPHTVYTKWINQNQIMVEDYETI